MRQRVIILGGGIAGLSAAHELVERGFTVEVFERRTTPGGKARSMDADGAVPFDATDAARHTAAHANGARRDLPGEHGFRFFPGFYRHVIDTMRRIPYGSRSVADNLVDTTRVQWAWFDRAPIELPTRFPQTNTDIQHAIQSLLATLGGQAGIPPEETIFFGGKLLQIMSSCEERRLEQYERIDWWRFIDASRRSSAYQKIYGHAITRSLVAAKADRASTKTVGDIFIQMLLSLLRPGESSDRLLNGPTNDVWLDPWVQYLMNRGVRYHFGSDVRSINCRDGRVLSATIAQRGRTFAVEADYFVLAVPVERAVELLNPALLAADPTLAHLRELSQYVEWMNGIQFFLSEDVPIVHGHSIFIDSPWAITSVSQQQFWPGVDLSARGDGRVHGTISVDISDFFAPGLNGKSAVDCTREEIAMEVWNQLKRSLNGPGREVLKDAQLHSWFLDPDIIDDPGNPHRRANTEPLLVNYVDTWRLRPEAASRIPNLFLASDYVRTHTDLATMEAANEAARRAVNGVLEAAGVSEERCKLWNLHEVPAFSAWREYDRARLKDGQPWDDSLVAFGSGALGLARQAGLLGSAVWSGAGLGALGTAESSPGLGALPADVFRLLSLIARGQSPAPRAPPRRGGLRVVRDERGA
jgi:uncharacterized protein with NAD-binding domain and iron-sulfur cluster